MVGRPVLAPRPADGFTFVLKGSFTLTEYLEAGGGVSGAERKHGDGTCEGWDGSTSSNSPSSGDELLSCLLKGRAPVPVGGVEATRLLEP
jgi:hypothetical protein